MKHTFSITIFSALMLFLAPALFAQQTYSIKNANIRIDGTSTLHAWEMTSASGNGSAKVMLNGAGRVASIQGITYTLAVNSLKSKTNGLDNNAYKAMKQSKHPNITFNCSNATATTSDGTNYTIKAPGKLTISGTTKNLELNLKGKMNADKSMTVTGAQKINMSEYGVEPPSFMFGAMKTGDAITITINSTIKQ